jgi:hypothetical protein
MSAQEHEITVLVQGKQRNTASSTTASNSPLWHATGLASISGGALLVIGHLIELVGPVEYGEVVGLSLVLVAHLVLIFALVGIYAAQLARMRVLGNLGMVLSVLGTALVSGVVLVEIAGASGAEVEAVLTGGVAGILAQIAGLSFFIGLILFGIATMRAAIFPWPAGLLLIVGDLVFGAGTSGGSTGPILIMMGAVLTAAGLVWLGTRLMTQIGRVTG